MCWPCRVGEIDVDDAFDLAVDVQQRRRGIAQGIVDRGALRAAEAGKVIDSRGEGRLDRTQVGGIREIDERPLLLLDCSTDFRADRTAVLASSASTPAPSAGGIGRQGRRDLDRSFLGEQRRRVHTRSKG